MLDFFDDLKLRNTFIEIDFNTSPFQFLSIKRINLSPLIESFLQKLKEEPEKNLENERTITFTYQNENYFVFKYIMILN